MRVSYVKPGQTNPLELFVRGRRAAEESDFGIYINIFVSNNAFLVSLRTKYRKNVTNFLENFLIENV